MSFGFINVFLAMIVVGVILFLTGILINLLSHATKFTQAGCVELAISCRSRP